MGRLDSLSELQLFVNDLNYYGDVVVKKPWGEEYLCYRNGEVAIWFLYIKAGEKTSMHCHPTKNTGLVVLKGSLELSFIRNKISLEGLDKIHIFRSRFHSSYAKTDSFLFEVESPEDKEDLVRLDDKYGRGTGYEGKEFFRKKEKTIYGFPILVKEMKFDCMVVFFDMRN